MAKSDLSKILAYSLTVGTAKTDNIQLGSTEAWLPERAVPGAYGPRDAFAKLVASANAIETIIKTLTDALPTDQAKSASDLEKAITAIKKNTNAFEHEKRAALTTEIGNQQKKADALLAEVQTLRQTEQDYQALPEPVITVTDTIDVYVNSGITAASFGASVTPNVPLQVRTRDNAVVSPTGFSQPGTRVLLVVAPATATTKYAERKVTANLTFRARKLTCPPDVKEFEWGVDITPAMLGITDDGPTLPTITNPEACNSVGEHTLNILSAAKDQHGAAKGTVKVRIVPAERLIEWTLPNEFLVGDRIMPKSLGITVKLVKSGAVMSDARPLIRTPVGDVFKAAGDAMDLTVWCAETKVEKEATRTAKVKVVKRSTAITWQLPSSMAKGAALPAAATIDPVALQNRLVLNPAAGSVQNRIGPLVVNASYAGDAAHEAAASQVKILVVEAARMIAGANAANAGNALKPLAGPAQARLDDWNNSDPTDPKAIGTMGKRLMRDVSAMDSAAVKAFIAQEGANNPDVKKVKNKTLPDGSNMVILSYKNGLEVRHKDDGGNRYEHKPTVSIEIRNDPNLEVSNLQGDIAFKLTMTGEPGPKGTAETLVPPGVNINDFEDGAMKATHLVLR